MSEGTVGDAERPGETEVSKLDTSTDINEKVLRLEVAVDDSMTVTKRDAV